MQSSNVCKALNLIYVSVKKGTRVKYFLQRILKVCHIDFKMQYLAATWSAIDVNNNEQY